MSLFLLVLATTPTIETPVTDPQGYLTASDREAIATDLVSLRDTTGVQMAVLVVQSINRPIEDYAQTVFDRWEGGSAERDDGVLLVISVGGRRNRLHLGYGLEQFIPDGVARQILDAQIGNFRVANYAGAIRGIVAGVAERVGSLRPGEPISRPLGMSYPGALVLVLVLALIGGLAWGLGTIARRPLDFEDYDALELDESAPPPARHLGWSLALWIGAPLVLAAIFYEGHLFWLGYPLAWYFGAGLAALFVVVYRRLAAQLAVSWIWIAAMGTFIVGAGSMPRSVATGAEIIEGVWMLLLVAGGTGIFAMFAHSAASSPGGSGGGGGWSGGTSSGWGGASSSTSRSWGSSSSSSSSSSWGGGGGSSGGGGASSGW